MFYRTVFLVVVFVGLTVADIKSSEFVAIESRDGQERCAVDEPTAVDWYPAHGSVVHCGLQCLGRIDCKAFNFNSLLGKCDQYELTPTNFSVIPGCKGYAIETCPEGWVRAGFKCYTLLPRMFVGWQESRDYCSAIEVQRKRSQLVVIDSEEKQRFIHKLLFTAFSGIFGYSNLALRKSAFQISTRTTDAGCCVAEHAVDGIMTNKVWQSCTHTLDEPPPLWWAVDLGSPIFVFGVNLTTRADCCDNVMEDTNSVKFGEDYVGGDDSSWVEIYRFFDFFDYSGSRPTETSEPILAHDSSRDAVSYSGERLNNFAVALTNTLSSSSFPRNYTLCGKWPGVAPTGATMFVGCASDLAPSRYVAIIVTDSPAMSFCQVQVYGIRGLIWLAGRRKTFNDPSSSFVWSPFSDSEIPMSYSNWNITGPIAVGDGNCAAMDATTGKWINAPCSSTNVYTLCELP